MPDTPARTWRRLSAVAVTVAAIAALVFGTAAGAATGGSLAAKPGTTVHYAVNRPLCAQPADPQGFRCFALKRVNVKKGTPGSYAYSTKTDVQRGPSGGYTPNDLAAAYGYNPSVDRSSSTVAIVDWYDDPYALKDLNSFDSHYGLHRETSRSFRKVNQNGKTSPLPRASRGSAGETALDVETVRAVCHRCRILLVEASRPSDVDLAAAENTAVRLGATEISNSFGEPEHHLSAKVLAAFNHPGVVITASTGDEGYLGWDYANEGYPNDGVPAFPSTDPNVVAVGGTTLTLNSNGTRQAETVWNGNGPDNRTGRARHRSLGASGGGCSRYFAAKPWQSHYPGYAAAGCRGKRLATDVAVLGDPETGFDVLDRYGSGGWVTVGGTSLSAPIVAALYAIAGGSGGARYPSSALYVNAGTRTYTRYDVTSGGNGYCGGDTTTNCGTAVRAATVRTSNPNRLGYGVLDCSFAATGNSVPATRRTTCNATTGLDGPTGVGTPRTSSLFHRTLPSLSVKRPWTKKVKRPARFVAHAHESIAGTHVLHYSWSWGDGHSSRTKHAATHHSYRHPGRYSVTLTVDDSRYQTATKKVHITIKR